MKAVILAGGLGTRMREEAEFKPKPMVEVGGKPVLWHIMKILATQGISEFVIAAGHKAEVIKDYFIHFNERNRDFLVTTSGEAKITFVGNQVADSWSVTVADTGQATMTGGRVKAVQGYVGEERFLVTYGDGIAPVNLQALLKTHLELGTIATLTATYPVSRFGVLERSEDGRVTRFLEKPVSSELVNIGYMIMEPAIFEFLDENSVLEQEPLQQLAREGKLGSYTHNGFWQPMDTPREAQQLNEIWNSGNAPWKLW